MSLILKEAGFKDLESLQDFSMRYPHISGSLDSRLENIWICHKNSEKIPSYEDINLPQSGNYIQLYNEVKKKIDSDKEYFSLLTEFNPILIFEKIYSYFQLPLTSYIFKNCFVFYKWRMNSFEPLIDHYEVDCRIEKRSALLHKVNEKKVENENINNTLNSKYNIKMCNKEEKKRHNSCTGSKILSYKKVPFKSFKNAVVNTELYFDLPRNPNDPSQESFNLKKILYDMNQRPQWPKSHILSLGDVQKLFTFIVEVPVGKEKCSNKLMSESNKWTNLKHLIKMFMERHKKVEKNNGFGRILKSHLKSLKSTLKKKLVPIPKSTVISYILDILRRVVPMQMYGSNRLRKKFFSSLIKVINGSKEENFIWHPLLLHLFKEKSEMTWCSEISDEVLQNLMILKVFKFIIIDYVFIILKCNFYVTETGSSGFGLRFYRKGDVERASHKCVNSLLYYKHLKTYKRADQDLFTLERQWVDTGTIDESDLIRQPKKLMLENTEFKQPIARIRFLPKTDENNEMRIITNVPPKVNGNLTINPESEKLSKIFEARTAQRQTKLKAVKLLLESVIDEIGTGIKAVPNNPVLEAAWEKAISLKERHGKLYFVKADIADAFGSVKYDVLIKVLEKAVYERSIQPKNFKEWKVINSKIKKVTRLSFSRKPSENSVLINRTLCVQNSIRDLDFLSIITQVVMQQRVKANGRIFKLTKGLAQGSVGKFSPQLCEIYYSSMDNVFFKGIIDCNKSVLLRGADDYLLITSDLKKAEWFLQVVRGGIEYYGARFNNKKLQSNLIEDVFEVPYLGLTFNFSDMTVKPNYSKLQRTNLLSTIKLCDNSKNINFRKSFFLERKSLLFSSLKLHRILLNENHNNLKTIRRNVFQICLMQSARVMSLAKYLFQEKTANDLVVYKILMKSCSKIKQLVGNMSGLSNDEVHLLFLIAVLCIFRKFSGQFKKLLVILKFRIQQLEGVFFNNGNELLLNFLKNDLFREEFLKNINKFFMNVVCNTKYFN